MTYEPATERKASVIAKGKRKGKRKWVHVPAEDGRMIRKPGPKLGEVLDLKAEGKTKRQATITIIAVERQDENWIARFILKDHPELKDELPDRPLYLGKSGGFTMSASQQAVPGDPEYVTPFEKDLARAYADARAGRVVPEVEAVKTAITGLKTCREVMTNMRAAVLIKRAERNLEAAVRIVLSEGTLSSESSVAADGSQDEADRPPSDAPQPSLEEAA